MNASNPDIPGKVFEDPRSGSLIQRRVILMLTGVNFEWVKHGTEEDGEDNIFSGTLGVLVAFKKEKTNGSRADSNSNLHSFSFCIMR